MERPEYIKCVRHTHVDLVKKSWCGRDLFVEWCFVDAAHAAENGRKEGRLVACPECVSAIVMALQNGARDDAVGFERVESAPFPSERKADFAAFFDLPKPTGSVNVSVSIDTPKPLPPLEPGEFHIWSEGYSATGDRSGAIYYGKGAGADFRDACLKFFTERNQIGGGHYDPERHTYWGCRMFDNEAEARKSFG